MRKLIFIVFLVLSLNSFAQLLQNKVGQYDSEDVEFKITKTVNGKKEVVIYKGERYGHDGGVPIIMEHGWTSNTANKKDFAEDLINENIDRFKEQLALAAKQGDDEAVAKLKQVEEKGFDIFLINTRGHGRAHHETIFQANEFGPNGGISDSFSDIMALVKQIYHRSGNQKVYYSGFSMGAKKGFYFASGVMRDPLTGKMIIGGEDRVRELKKYVGGVILQGVPLDFSKMSKTTPLFLKPYIHKFMKVVGKKYGIKIPNWFSYNTTPNKPFEPSDILDNLNFEVRKNFLEEFARWIKLNMPWNPVLNPKNFTIDELIFYGMHGFSGMPLESTADLMKEGFTLEAQMGGVRAADLEKFHVPVLIIAGDGDDLCPHEAQIEYAKKLGAKIILLEGNEETGKVAHLDIPSSRRVRQRYIGDVLDFILKPDDGELYFRNYGPSEKELISVRAEKRMTPASFIRAVSNTCVNQLRHIFGRKTM